jgi:Na+-driven multidrug efflux pump
VRGLRTRANTALASARDVLARLLTHALKMEPTLAAFVRLSLPVSCAHVCMVLLQLTDLAVVGRLLGAEQLAVRALRDTPATVVHARLGTTCFAQAVCLVLVVVNLTLEPASFITANALTTLCGDSLSSQNVAQIGVSVRAAVLFCLLLTLPIGGLLLGTPALLSLLTASPNDVLAHAAEYAPAYVLVVTPALLQSVLLGLPNPAPSPSPTPTPAPTPTPNPNPRCCSASYAPMAGCAAR